MNADVHSPVLPVEVTADNVERVLSESGCRPADFPNTTGKREFFEELAYQRTAPGHPRCSDFPHEEIFLRLDDEEIEGRQGRTFTEQEVAKIISDLIGWIINTSAPDPRHIRLAGSKAIVAAWVIRPSLFGDQSARTVSTERGLHPDKFSKKAAEFSRTFKIQNRFQRHDSKNQKQITSEL